MGASEMPGPSLIVGVDFGTTCSGEYSQHCLWIDLQVHMHANRTSGLTKGPPTSILI